MNNKLVKTLLKPIAGKKLFQKLFEKLYLFSIYGMNYGNGSYLDKSGELKAIKYIQKKIKKDKIVVFDVGANVGGYSMAIKNVFGESVEIHCFEPSLSTYKKLKERLSSLKTVFINNFGLGDKKNRLKLYSDHEGSELASVYDRKLAHRNTSMDLFEEVEIDTLDEYCSKNNIGFIDFLKLDVEGHELKVLEGGKKMLDANKLHFIQFEFGGCNIDSKIFFQDFFYLLNDKYKIYRILVDGLFEIKTYNETMEVFTTINYLAELRNS